ncbi:MAG: tetratricopeptide repeat protein, partial [Chitinophagaceae bacterium]|nr:tetratricopeptide repeat protein [Chitinophagaceae bacterium]
KLLPILISMVVQSQFTLFAQNRELDSIRAEIDKHPARDTTRFRLIRNYTMEAVNNNTSLIQPYVNEMISISKEKGYLRGLQIAYSTQETYFADRGDFPQAFLYADSAFTAFEGDTSKAAIIEKAFLHHNVGIDNFKIGNYEASINHYMQAAEILETKKPASLPFVYEGIAEVYDKLLQDDKSVEYDKKAIASAEKYGTPIIIAGRYLNYITRLVNRKQFKEAESLLNKVEPITKQNNKPIQSFLFYECKGQILQGKKQFNEAIAYLNQANAYAHINDDIYQQLAILNTLANCHIDAGQLDKARLYLDTLLNKSASHEMKTYRLDAYTLFAKWYENKLDYKSANEYLNKKLELSDTIMSDEMKEKVTMMETRYKVAGKDREIEGLITEKKIQALQIRQRNTLNYLLIGSLIALLIISMLGYRNYQSRQKLQQAKIDELETEKKLTATEAILKGEEQERTRLAKDLHDGLGGMLSGIKHSLNYMKGNLIMTPDNAQAFERSIDMLDSSIKEMRRVAHNMMPEILVRYGLDSALNEFCNEITRSGVTNITYQSIGMKDKKMDQTTAVAIYRIVQELVNNAIKHAAAKNILVQAHASSQEKIIAITVEDDGKGFDKSILKEVRGMGWSNIQNRVDFLKGRIDVNSEKDKGTSVLIEINDAE